MAEELDDPPRTARVGVAAFDFDGTLIDGDSFGPFLVRVAGRRAFRQALLTGGIDMARSFRTGGRDGAKASLLARLFRGYPIEELRVHGEEYAASLRARIRTSMTDRMGWHRDQAHQLVMVSASLAVYLEPLGRELAFDGVLATNLEVDGNGRLTGALQGANVRRAEKATRLSGWLHASIGDRPCELWAYGDSVGDRELLAMADHPMRV